MPEAYTESFSHWLQLGQKLEAEGKIADAIAAYDRAIALLRSSGSSREIADRRALGIAWMNRGNALQKLPASSHERERVDSESTHPDVLAAYDAAIALFETLPYETDPAFRNHLGAAWLNRGHALLVANRLADAAHSFEQAIALLQTLPLETDPYYRLNLSGAQTNLAHATFATTPERALAATRAALETLRDVERAHDAFAAMSLRARRAMVMAIGEILRRGSQETALANEATDAIEDGLALMRDYETRGNPTLRPLAARLFQLGAQIYRIHQPHFLAEFVLESLATPSLAADPAFRTVADAALADTLADLQRPQLFVAGTPDSDRRRDIAATLRSAQERLATSSAEHPSSTNKANSLS